MPDLTTPCDPLVACCPTCAARFRLKQNGGGPKRLTLRCRRCGTTFVHCTARQLPEAPVLVAHGEAQTGNAIAAALADLQLSCRLCADGEALLREVTRAMPAVVLLDVGLPDGPVHSLVDEIRTRPGGDAAGILLLASVFRSDAYCRRPVELHGADGYLDPHRLAEQLPERIRPFCRAVGSALLTARSVEEEARVLQMAKGIATDIALLNRDRLDTSIRDGNIAQAFGEVIYDGETLLRQRLGEGVAEKYPGAVGRAFAQLVEQRLGELNCP